MDAEDNSTGGGRKSALKQAKDKMKKGSSGPKVTLEHTVTEDDLRKK